MKVLKNFLEIFICSHVWCRQLRIAGDDYFICVKCGKQKNSTEKVFKKMRKRGLV